MSFMDRIKRIAKGNLNELLEKAEKPEIGLKGHIHELQKHLKEAKDAVAEFAVTHKKNEKELDQLKRMRDEWQYKAEASLKSGDEALAKRALGERIKIEERIHRLDPAVSASRKTYSDLKEQVIELSDNLKSAQSTLAELQTRDRAANAQQKFGRHVDLGATTESLDFSKFEDAVLQKEAAVELDREIRGEMSDLDSQLNHQNKTELMNREFESLKQQVGKTPSE